MTVDSADLPCFLSLSMDADVPDRAHCTLGIKVARKRGRFILSPMPPDCPCYLPARCLRYRLLTPREIAFRGIVGVPTSAPD